MLYIALWSSWERTTVITEHTVICLNKMIGGIVNSYVCIFLHVFCVVHCIQVICVSIAWLGHWISKLQKLDQNPRSLVVVDSNKSRDDRSCVRMKIIAALCANDELRKLLRNGLNYIGKCPWYRIIFPERYIEYDYSKHEFCFQT